MGKENIFGKSLVTLTSFKQTTDHNIVRIHREFFDLDAEKVLHVAGGPHVGVIINKPDPTENVDIVADVTLSFSVWLTNKHGANEAKVQEKRTLLFKLSDEVSLDHGRSVVHKFFKNLMASLPRDYVAFMKKALKLLHSDFPEISDLILDFKIVEKHEQVAIPDAAQYDSGSEVEEVTSGHVQEVLEHAFPNGLPVSAISEALRCSEDMALNCLKELEAIGVVRRVEDEWIRVDAKKVDDTVTAHRAANMTDQPTVAIISCLFIEKQAIDSLIEESSTIHKYKSGGDSNVYTLGRIGSHRVVATKLALIGDSREAITSAGSITTRLLGNFQKIEHVFVVGIGGAVPHYTDAKLHARLGDVIVSASMPHAYVYAHDLLFDRKTDVITGFAIRNWDATDKGITNIVVEGDEQLRDEWNAATKEAIKRLSVAAPDVEWHSPPESSDVLAMPVARGNVIVMPHPNVNRTGPEIHLGTVGAMASLKKYAAIENEEDTASQIRESFAESFGVRCMDVGFDSVVASIVGSCIGSWALIRGVADYQHGQSRAGKLWQAYAAARAAGMVRAIVDRLPPPS